MWGESGRSGCEKHAESPKPRQGQQKQEDQLCSRVHARVCVCAVDRQLGEPERWCAAMNDRPLPV